jgi:hypothetical protein
VRSHDEELTEMRERIAELEGTARAARSRLAERTTEAERERIRVIEQLQARQREELTAIHARAAAAERRAQEAMKRESELRSELDNGGAAQPRPTVSEGVLGFLNRANQVEERISMLEERIAHSTDTVRRLTDGAGGPDEHRPD